MAITQNSKLHQWFITMQTIELLVTLGPFVLSLPIIFHEDQSRKI